MLTSHHIVRQKPVLFLSPGSRIRWTCICLQIPCGCCLSPQLWTCRQQHLSPWPPGPSASPRPRRSATAPTFPPSPNHFPHCCWRQRCEESQRSRVFPGERERTEALRLQQELLWAGNHPTAPTAKPGLRWSTPDASSVYIPHWCNWTWIVSHAVTRPPQQKCHSRSPPIDIPTIRDTVRTCSTSCRGIGLQGRRHASPLAGRYSRWGKYWAAWSRLSRSSSVKSFGGVIL